MVTGNCYPEQFDLSVAEDLKEIDHRKKDKWKFQSSSLGLILE